MKPKLVLAFHGDDPIFPVCPTLGTLRRGYMLTPTKVLFMSTRIAMAGTTERTAPAVTIPWSSRHARDGMEARCLVQEAAG